MMISVTHLERLEQFRKIINPNIFQRGRSEDDNNNNNGLLEEGTTQEMEQGEVCSVESDHTDYDDSSPPFPIDDNSNPITTASANSSIFYRNEEEPDISSFSIWKRMPNSAWGVSMACVGQAICWKSAGTLLFKDNESVARGAIGTSTFFWTASIIVALIVGVAYIYKAINYFQFVKDELNHGVRVHFFNMPHLIMIMLAISVPKAFVVDGIVHVACNMTVWTIGFIIQLVLTSSIYERWLFSPPPQQEDNNNNIVCARPQFLLSTVGFFLLASFGASAGVEESWGIALPSFCLGVGFVFYAIVVNSIFHGLHSMPKGNPALFLLIAPPSVGVVALEGIIGDEEQVNILSEMVFGWCLGILLLLLKLGPQITASPPCLGAYWSYVFPLSALATASIQIDSKERNQTTWVMAIALLALASLVTLIVFLRNTYHTIQVARGTNFWKDGLLTKQKIMAAIHIREKLRQQ